MPLQRSAHESAVDVPAVPATVQPGETVDWPYPIAGFVPVGPPPSVLSEGPSPVSKKKPSMQRTSTEGVAS